MPENSQVKVTFSHRSPHLPALPSLITFQHFSVFGMRHKSIFMPNNILDIWHERVKDMLQIITSNNCQFSRLEIKSFSVCFFPFQVFDWVENLPLIAFDQGLAEIVSNIVCGLSNEESGGMM